MGNHFSCIRGDSKKPSKKWVRRKPYSTTTVTSSSTLSEILRRYSLYTTQHGRHHGFWRKKKVNPQEASRESPAHRGREVGERPVNVRVVQVAPLRCGSSEYSGITHQENNLDAKKAPCEDAVHDIVNEDAVHDIANDAVYDIANEDAIRDIANEDAVQNITNEDAVRNITNDAVHDISIEDAVYDIANEDTVYDLANQDTVQDICKKEEAAKESFILENDLTVESISDDDDFAGQDMEGIKDGEEGYAMECGAGSMKKGSKEVRVVLFLPSLSYGPIRKTNTSRENTERLLMGTFISTLCGHTTPSAEVLGAGTRPQCPVDLTQGHQHQVTLRR
ncbi:uncharacterized protein LOC100599221 [Nomascus leucogenys]|uniref:uncharacterized protein LOC100599221 n=1 Tax=Nomascus leucogenys TaxID=61853 RepID=UPI00122DADF7|nr:uncharacterized protein LOC100599221 [Nomascus leucogenys]